MNGLFYVNSLLFGIGLAVDAFLVALANGMSCPSGKARAWLTAIAFAVFQFGATMIGWVVAHTAFEYYASIEIYLSWAAVVVIVALGVRMIVKGTRKKQVDHVVCVGVLPVLAECAATSVDALTVGFTVEEYGTASAALCSTVIATVTFIMYIVGFAVGKKFGTGFEKAASVIGGAVFFAIAVEIIVTTYLG